MAIGIEIDRRVRTRRAPRPSVDRTRVSDFLATLNEAQKRELDAILCMPHQCGVRILKEQLDAYDADLRLWK